MSAETGATTPDAVMPSGFAHSSSEMATRAVASGLRADRSSTGDGELFVAAGDLARSPADAPVGFGGLDSLRRRV